MPDSVANPARDGSALTLAERIAQFSRRPVHGIAGEVREARDVVVVPPRKPIEDGFEQARKLLAQGLPVRLVAHGATLEASLPHWARGERALLLTELGAYVHRYYVDEVMPLRTELRAWLGELFAETLPGLDAGEVLYGSACARFLQRAIDAGFFTGGLQLAHPGARFHVTDRTWPGALALGIEPEPVNPLWRGQLLALTFGASFAAAAWQCAEYWRSRQTLAALRAQRMRGAAVTDSRVWLALCADWYRLNRHLIDSVGLPELAAGRALGVLLLPRLVPGTRDESDLRRHVGRDSWAGLGPLKDHLEKISVDQAAGPESPAELARTLWSSARSMARVVARFAREPRILSRGPLRMDLASHVGPLARLATQDLVRALTAAHAAARAADRSALSGSLVVFAASNLAESSAVDVAIQARGGQTIEFFHGAGAEGWVGTQESAARWRGVWTHADAIAIERLGRKPLVAGMPRRLAHRSRVPLTGPVKLLMLSNYVHRDFAIEGTFPYESFQRELLRLPALVRAQVTGELQIRWRPHPADNPKAVARTFATLEQVERTPNPLLEADVEWADVIVSSMSTAVVEALFSGPPIFLHVPPEFWEVPNVRALSDERIFFYAEEGARRVAACILAMRRGEKAVAEPEAAARRSYFGPTAKPLGWAEGISSLKELQMLDSEATIAAMARDGFARLGNPFSPEQLDVLRAEVDRLYKEPREPFAKLQQEKRAGRYGLKVLENSDWSVALDVAGFSPEFDALLEHALSHPAVKAVLEGVLGAHYKLEQVNVRRAEPGGNGQHLHQDAVGEMGMTILVRDLPQLGGATAFLPGSHRWPVRYSDVGITFDPWWLKPVLGAATGRAGDVFFFFNRTWHGRFSNQQQADAIMMSFFGVGAECRARPVPPSMLAAFGPELRRVIDPTQGFEPASEGRSTVVGPAGQRTAQRVPPFDQVLADRVPAPISWLPARAWGAMTRTVRRVANLRHRLNVQPNQ